MVEFIWTLFENVQIEIDAKCANNHKVSILANSTKNRNLIAASKD